MSMQSWSARSLTTNRLIQQVNLTAHGFSIGQILQYNSNTNNWYPAIADTYADAVQTIGMVSYIYSANVFFITQCGYITGITTQTLTPVQSYYLSTSSAGLMQANMPNVVGQGIVSCFVADTESSGFFNITSLQPVNALTEFTWQTVTTNTMMLPNNGYLVNGSTALTMTLPATINVNDIIEVVGLSGGNGWVIAQNAGQTCHAFGGSTTTGTSGNITSAENGDTILLICSTANTDLQKISGEGNMVFN